MFGQRVQNMATANMPTVREARRNNGKPRKQMPSPGIPAMTGMQAQDAPPRRIDHVDELVQRMREIGPPEQPQAPQSGDAAASPVGISLAYELALRRLMEAQAAAMFRKRLM